MMVSTHYNEQRTMRTHTAGIENGHVEFDERTLKPTYRLHIGELVVVMHEHCGAFGVTKGHRQSRS